MGEGSYKAPKGLIRVKISTKGSTISEITISGDFFMHPEELLWKLEKTLLGADAIREAILSRVQDFYRSTGALTPGVTPQDFSEAVMRALSSV
ncbi:lipoate--protein ligase family protein [Candidatus Bathyarchaeota archaeon]|nr:lipoate--protein ligase family protein [Candidatus Bathyarchaeota archaeon]